MPRHILLTNIGEVQIAPRTRMRCSALLLEDREELCLNPDSRYQIRAFGPHPVWEVLTHWLQCPIEPYELTGAQDDSVLIGSSEDGYRPLFQGSLLQFPDGTKYFLIVADAKRPIDVTVFDSPRTDYDHLWAVLTAKTREYWPGGDPPRLFPGAIFR